TSSACCARCSRSSCVARAPPRPRATTTRRAASPPSRPNFTASRRNSSNASRVKAAEERSPRRKNPNSQACPTSPQAPKASATPATRRTNRALTLRPARRPPAMRHDARIPTFALALALAAPAFATPPAPPPPPANQDSPKPEKAPSERPRSLDDLLGLPERSDKADAPPPPDTAPEQAQRELERALRGESVGEMFEEAVLLMRDAAQRVDQRRDVGATTQRMQEEIIARLDAVIAKARQQQQQQQSSSSSSSSSQSEQQQQPGQR